MQDQTFSGLRKALSVTRLESYRPNGGTDEDAVANYLWNSALCESLFPMLQQLEVSFHNALHTSIGKAISDASWLSGSATWLQPREVEKIQKARQDLIDQSQTVTEGRMVGELSFGFWTSLTNRPYERAWPKFVKDAFPKAPSHCRNRTEVSARVNKLRKLRNAVFHHHSIWHWSDLTLHHNTGFELMDWIEPELAKLVRATDRFPQIYAKGRAAFNDLVSN